MDTNQLGLNVHIVPLGFEVDRVIAPFKNRQVDKVILVTPEYMDDTEENKKKSEKQAKYLCNVQKKLTEMKIIVENEETKLFDLNETIRTLSSLIRREKEAGNQVSINISSSGRFVSVGAALAGMAHDITVYYVNAKEYSNEDDFERGVSRCDLNNPSVRRLTNFKLTLPNEEEALILELLYVIKRDTDNPWASLNEIGAMLHHFFQERYPWKPEFKKRGASKTKTDEKKEAKTGEYRTHQSQFLVKFNTYLARDLASENYIVRKEGERKHVYYQITDSGKYALFLYGVSGRIQIGEDGDITYT